MSILTSTVFFNHGVIVLAPLKPQAIPTAEAGRDAAAFDICIDEKRMDLATPAGFANALWAVCSLKPGSGYLTAPVCSSFVIVTLF